MADNFIVSGFAIALAHSDLDHTSGRMVSIVIKLVKIMTSWSDLGISFPVVQAPMAGSQGSELALAVAAAGGLGSIPAAMLSPEQLESELSIMQAAEIPYNVNFFCHQPPVDQAAAMLRWQDRLQPYFDDYQLDSAKIPSAASRQPFNQATADLVAPFRPPVVSFHFGLPEQGLLDQVKAWGSLVMSSATTVAEALWLQEHGADVVIAQGVEAGGHRGLFLSDDLNLQLPLSELLPACLEQLTIPVIAAGGIGTAEQVQEVLSQGAVAAQIGTTYLLCHESKSNALQRQALESAQTGATQLTNIFSGRPARGIANLAMRELGPISDQVPAFPLAGNAMGMLRQGAETQGRDDFTPLWSGVNNQHCDSISAKQMTLRLAGVTE